MSSVTIGLFGEHNQLSGLRAGSRLGRYEIVAPIGKGGMGEVYRARDSKLERDVAIKVLPTETCTNPERLRRFEDEARTLGQLSHANIVAIYDSGTAGDMPYVVTELLEGGTLRELLKRGPLDTAHAVEVATQMARGLAAAHAKRVVHRDLKPANVFITRHGEVKLLDFGLAKLVHPEWEKIDADGSTVSMTSPGMVMGTIGYMAPEQLEGHTVDATADLFAFGAVLYEMLTGDRAFDGSSPASIAAAILREQPRHLAAETEKIPSWLLPIIKRCLEKKPEARFQSARDLVFALEQQSRPSHVTFSTATLQAIRESMSRPSVRRGAAFTGLTAILIVTLLVVATGRGPEALPQPTGAAATRPFRITRVTTSGNVTAAGVSPDAVYVAYVVRDDTDFKLKLRHVPTGSEVQLASSIWIDGVRISPDRNFVYYSSGESSLSLYRVPLLGGESQKLVDDIRSFSFSRSGDRIAFVRSIKEESAVWVATADGRLPRRVAALRDRTFQVCGWSPDGRKLACLSGGLAPARSMLVVDVVTGHAEEKKGVFRERDARQLQAFEWGEEGTILGATGPFVGAIWRAPLGGGTPERLTNDLAGYGDLTLAPAAKTIAAAQVNTIFNLLRIDVDDPTRPRLITSGFNTLDGRMGVATLRDGRILYASNASGRSEDIWIANEDGSGKRRITLDDETDEVRPTVASDETFFVFIRRSETSSYELWRADLDGQNARKLTDHAEGPSISADGAWVYFTRNGANGPRLYRIPSGGGESAMLFDRPCAHVKLSPDGTRAMATCREPDPKTIIWRFDGKGEEKSFPGFLTGHRWRPDGKAFAYSNGKSANIWLQPLDGTPPKQITNFADQGYSGFEWSRDGKSLIVPRWQSATDVVLLTESD